MRNAFAIIAVCCLLFLNMGYYVLYQLRLAEVKESMHKEILQAKKHELTRLVFSKQEMAHLNWEEANEFCYHNDMYDVVEMKDEGENTVILCLPDEKEKELRIAYLNTQHPASEKSQANSILKLLNAPFLSNFAKEEFFNTVALLEFNTFQVYFPIFLKIIITPPPKVA